MRKIEELTPEEMKRVADDYMAGEITVKEIVEKYELDIYVSSLVKYLPAVKTEKMCPYCNEPMYAKINGRGTLADPYCEKCGHIEYALFYHNNLDEERCKCVNCLMKQKRKREEQQRIIVETYNKEYLKIPFGELTLRDKFHIITIIRYADYDCENKEWFFRGNYECFRPYFSDLVDRNIFVVSPNSSIEAFNEHDFPNNVNYRLARYKCNVLFYSSDISSIKENTYTMEASPEEKYELFMEVMHKDVLDRFGKEMRDRRLDLEVHVGAEDAFKNLYDVLSYGQIMSLCKNVAKHLLDLVTTRKMMKIIANRAALKTVVKFYENSKKNGWKIYNSEISYAGTELKDLLEAMGVDIHILQRVATVKDFE